MGCHYRDPKKPCPGLYGKGCPKKQHLRHRSPSGLCGHCWHRLTGAEQRALSQYGDQPLAVAEEHLRRSLITARLHKYRGDAAAAARSLGVPLEVVLAGARALPDVLSSAPEERPEERPR